MVSPILTTKLFIPPLRPDLLPRPDLVKKLEGMAAYPLTLISAAAGYGKTTILSEWVSTAKVPAAWISLDSGDNDPSQFLRYIITALQTIQENFGQDLLESHNSGQSDLLGTSLIKLINQLANFPQHSFLLFDDYHTITNPQVHDIVIFLVDHLPPQIHLVFASRVDPPWPLARYRARNQLYEIRGKDLRFKQEETMLFLNHSVGLNLSDKDLSAIEERTEGWVAGLQLAALSMQGHRNLAQFVKDFTGSHIFVAEYLIEEILQQQPDDIKSFLLETSILERLNAGLCEWVTQCQDGKSILNTLHRANVFIIPLDNHGHWFRYHHLFADLLQSRLLQTYAPEKIAGLHIRAANWFDRNQFYLEAVHHALIAKDYEYAADLVEKQAYTLIYSGRIKVLRDWMDALPDGVIQSHPHLNFFLFWIDLLQGKADFSEAAIQEKEALLKSLPPTPENDQLRGELMAVVCRVLALSGRTAQGIRMAQEALVYLPPQDSASRARVNSALAIALELEGRPQDAKQIYQRCFSQAATAGDHLLGVHTLMAKGLVQYRSGLLNQAAKTFQSIIDIGSQQDANTLLRTGKLPSKKTMDHTTFLPSGQGYIGMAHVLLERNDLSTAEEFLIKGMDLCRQGGLDGIFIGKLQMSRLHKAHGNLDKALAEIQFLKSAFARADDYNVTAQKIMIELDRGDLSKARQLAEAFIKILNGELDDPRMPLLFYEIIEAVVARVYISFGKVDEALELLSRLEATAKPGKRSGRLVEIHLLRALAYQKQSESSLPQKAVAEIIQSLELAAPQKYVLLFLDEGPAITPVLQAAAANKNAPDPIKKYAKQLLRACSERNQSPAKPPDSNASALVEPLTPREMEVLALLAAGDSNQEIADKLVITVRTVKKHTSNIYSKLGVGSRTQAVAYAREIGMLPSG